MSERTPRPRLNSSHGDSGGSANACRTWFITGASRGFGRQWAIAALERGDSVAATARRTETLDDLAKRFRDRLLPAPARRHGPGPATSRRLRAPTSISAGSTWSSNNAGYGQFGMIEELTEAEIRAQFERTSSARIWVTQAALPFMREQGSGQLIQVSSIGGVLAFADIGIYNASNGRSRPSARLSPRKSPASGSRSRSSNRAVFATDWEGPPHAPRPARLRKESRGGQPAAGSRVAQRRRPGRLSERDPGDRGSDDSAAAHLLRRRTAGHERRPTKLEWPTGASGSRFDHCPRARRSAPEGRGGESFLQPRVLDRSAAPWTWMGGH